MLEVEIELCSTKGFACQLDGMRRSGRVTAAACLTRRERPAPAAPPRAAPDTALPRLPGCVSRRG
jgi:hypothetical protein